MATPAEVIGRHRDDDCCMFTTTGRVSGRAHRLEIWFGVDGGAVYLISGNGPGSDWYRNAVANPDVTLEFDDDVVVGRAAPVTDAGERERIGTLMGVKYPWDGDASIGLTRHAWCYEVPLLKITVT